MLSHPNFLSKDESKHLSSVPSFILFLKIISPLKSTVVFIMIAKSLMDISLPEPMLKKGGRIQEIGDRFEASGGRS